MLEEIVFIETVLLSQDGIDGAAELMPQNRHRLALTVFPGHFGHIAFATLTLAHEQRGRFRKGPFEMGIADPSTRKAVALSCRLLGALHQSGIGAELLRAGESPYVLDFIEDHQCQHGTDTWHGL